MYKLLATVTSLISLLTIAFFKGKKSEQTKQVAEENLKLKNDNEVLQKDIQLIKKVATFDRNDAFNSMSKCNKNRKSK